MSSMMTSRPCSASGTVRRSGFERLAAEVCLGQVGAVAAREVLFSVRLCPGTGRECSASSRCAEWQIPYSRAMKRSSAPAQPWIASY